MRVVDDVGDNVFQQIDMRNPYCLFCISYIIIRTVCCSDLSRPTPAFPSAHLKVWCDVLASK